MILLRLACYTQVRWHRRNGCATHVCSVQRREHSPTADQYHFVSFLHPNSPFAINCKEVIELSLVKPTANGTVYFLQRRP